MAWMYPGSTGYGSAYSDSMSRNTLCHCLSRSRMNGRKLLLLSSSAGMSVTIVTCCIVGLSSMSSSSFKLASLSPCVISSIMILLLSVSGIIFCTRGIMRENVTEVSCFIMTSLACLLMIVIEYHAGHKGHTTSQGISMYTSAIGSIICIILARLTCCKFKCYRIVGATDSLRFMYEERTHVLAIMRMDLVIMILYALASFSLNNINNNINNNNNNYFSRIPTPANHTDTITNSNTNTIMSHRSYYGYYTCCVILLLAVIKWIMGKVSLMREITPLLYLYIVITMMSHLWIPYQLLHTSCFSATSCDDDQIMFTYISLVAAVAVIISQIYIMINLMRVYRNFGYGLTDRGEFDLFHSSRLFIVTNPSSLHQTS